MDENVFEKYRIANYNRSPILNGQFGLRAKMDINAFTVLGQYIGAEISNKLYLEVFHETSVEFRNLIYSFDTIVCDKSINKLKENLVNDNNIFGIKHQSVENNEYWFEDEKWRKFVIDPCIVFPLNSKQNITDEINDYNNSNIIETNIFKYINDCRKDISIIQRDKDDDNHFNVEFVRCHVNGWPQIYVVSIRQIHAGEQIMGFYGNDLNNAVIQKRNTDKKRLKLKQYVQTYIYDNLKHLKL